MNGFKSHICSLFQMGKCENLRTLSFVLDVARYFYPFIPNNEYKEDIARALLQYITVCSIEYKSGHTGKELEILSNFGKIVKFEDILLDDSKPNKESQNRSTFDDFKDDFDKRYH